MGPGMDMGIVMAGGMGIGTGRGMGRSVDSDRVRRRMVGESRTQRSRAVTCACIPPQVHYAYQANIRAADPPPCHALGGIEGNTGVYWARSVHQTISWFLKTPEQCRRTPHLDDQTLFWRLFWKTGLKRSLTCSNRTRVRQPSLCAFSPCLAPCGGFFYPPYTARKVRMWLWRNGRPDTPLLLHPNFLMGFKQKSGMLKALALWVTNPLGCSAAAEAKLQQTWFEPGNWTAQTKPTSSKLSNGV